MEGAALQLSSMPWDGKALVDALILLMTLRETPRCCIKSCKDAMSMMLPLQLVNKYSTSTSAGKFHRQVKIAKATIAPSTLRPYS